MEEDAASVQVRRPERVDRPIEVQASGTVEPREISKVGFQVAGRIRRILVEEGMAVRPGQMLAELDPTDYETGAAMARAEREAAQSLVDKARAGARRQELAQAKAALDLAEDEYRRYGVLFERKSLAPADFKKVETQLEVARQRYDEAREGARKEDVAAAEAKARQAGEAVALNAKKVTDTRLLAPIGGVIVKRLAEPGEMIAAGMPVVVVADLNPVRVKVGVAETDIARVRIGQRAEVRVRAAGPEPFAGSVELLGYAAEAETRTFPVRLLVPNPRLALRAGMTAESEIESAERVRALTLPGEAIIRDEQGATYVFVYSEEKHRVYGRRVETGAPIGKEVEVTSGLTGDEAVVVAGQHKVREGGLVKVVALAAGAGQ